ncbi:unnamed protein product [Brugia timori]|uniref:Uncharacterized protein n=1 Tax=Brugia timori TaxID=42155 RepID=A0A3P7WGD5_9BILA|nr:unnamed protein product [Brugia timori]
MERRFQAPDAPLTKFYDSWQKAWKLREDALNSVDVSFIAYSAACRKIETVQTKPVQRSDRLNLEQNTTAAVKTKSTVVVKANKIKKNNIKRARRKSEEIVVTPKGDEDVLEDLMLSDGED